MATTPLLTTYCTELRAAVAGMAAPTYNHTLSAGQVGDDPGDGTVPALPYVMVYVAGDAAAQAVTFRDRAVQAQIFVDVVIADQGSKGANRDAVLLLLHDLSQLLAVSRKSAIFAAPGGIVSMDHTINYHGDPEIGGLLPFGRLTLLLTYQRSAAGGF